MALREDTFQDELRQNPNPSSYDGIKPSKVNKYTFQTEAYNGTGGFDNNKYLIGHARESMYPDRREFSTYINFIRPIVRAMVEPVFKDEPERRFRETPIPVAFVNDVTLSGVDMTQFTESVLTWLRLHSVTFVVVDNTQNASYVESEEEAALNGQRPYAYIRTADKVESYDITDFGRLNSITFIERPVMVEKNGQMKEECRYRMWTKTESIVLRKNDRGDFEIVEQWSHNLGIVPVVVLYDNKPNDPAELLVYPKLRGVVKIAHSIFNKDSEIRDLERSQGFSFLCVQSDYSVDGQAALLTGPHNYIQIPTTSTIMPEYISPKTDVLKQLMDNRQSQKQDLFDLAEQSGVIAVSKEAKSGVALSYEFRAYEQTLAKSAELAEQIEYGIISIFERWTNDSIGYEITYNKEFKPSHNLEDVTMYEKISMIPGISNMTMAEINAQLHLIVDPEADQETIDKIREEALIVEAIESRVDAEETQSDTESI